MSQVNFPMTGETLMYFQFSKKGKNMIHVIIDLCP